MLPKNNLRHQLVKKLRIFPDEVHIYEEQLAGKESII
jgi:ribosomal protein L13